MANESGSESLEPTIEIVQSPFCASLRSKKFFMTASLPLEAADYIDGSNHCWCRETQQAIGPDGGMAQPEHCVAGRSCYSSAFEV